VVQLILIYGISLFVGTHSHTARSVAAALLLAVDLFLLAASLSLLCGALKRCNNLSNELYFYTSYRGTAFSCRHVLFPALVTPLSPYVTINAFSTASRHEECSAFILNVGTLQAAFKIDRPTMSNNKFRDMQLRRRSLLSFLRPICSGACKVEMETTFHKQRWQLGI
jgi:hypothetical protein